MTDPPKSEASTFPPQTPGAPVGPDGRRSPAPRSAASPAVVSLLVEPLDTLFFGDGRPFEPASRAASSLPTPQAMAGAVRTWLLGRAGADFAALGRAVAGGCSFAEAAAKQVPEVEAVGRLGLRGPWFTRNDERLVAMPATIERSNEDPDRLLRLDPLQSALPGWQPPEHAGPGLAPLWCRSRESTRRCGGYLGPNGLARFLAGDVPDGGDVVAAEELFDQEERVGVGIDPVRRAAADGLIYQVQMLRLRPGVALAVDLLGAPADLAVCPDEPDVLALGGEGRRAIVTKVTQVTRVKEAKEAKTVKPAPELVPEPERVLPSIQRRRDRTRRRQQLPLQKWQAVERPERARLPGGGGAAASNAGRLVLLTTPGLFGGWKPPQLQPVAAAVPGYLAVSGWDLARRGPKPTRFAVPAGSVYFLNHAPGLDGEHGALCSAEDAAAGWGAYHLGEWNHA